MSAETRPSAAQNNNKSQVPRNEQKTSKALQKPTAVTDNARSSTTHDPRVALPNAASNFDENAHASYKSESMIINDYNDDNDLPGDNESVAAESPSAAATSTKTPITTIVDPNIKLASSPEETLKLHYIEVLASHCVLRKHVEERGDKKIARKDLCTNSKCTRVKCFLVHAQSRSQVMHELRLLHSLKIKPSNIHSPTSQISDEEMDEILRGLKKPIKLDIGKTLAENLLQIADEKLRSVVKRLLNEELLREIEKTFTKKNPKSAIGFVCNFSKQKKNNNKNDDDDEEYHTLYHANSISGDDDTRTVFFIRPEYNTSKFEIVGIGQHADKSQSEDSKAYYDMSHYFFPKCGFLEENPRAIVNVASGLGLTKK